MGIRVGTLADLDVMHAIMVEAFQEFANEPVPVKALTESKEAFAQKLQNGEHAFIVTAQDGVDCGLVRYEIVGDTMYFYRLSIKKDYRCSGVGKRLLIELEREALRNDVRFIRCKVRLHASAKTFMYQNFGYVQYAEEIQERDGKSIYVQYLEKRLPVKV